MFWQMTGLPSFLNGIEFHSSVDSCKFALDMGVQIALQDDFKLFWIYT